MKEVRQDDLSFLFSTKVNARGTNVAVAVTQAMKTFNPIYELQSDVYDWCLIHGLWSAQNSFTQSGANFLFAKNWAYFVVILLFVLF